MTGVGQELGGAPRLQEQLGYAYDAGGNLRTRANNALVQTFGVDALNQLTNVSRAGTLTVAGTTTSAATNVTVNSLTAERYADHTFAKAGFTVTNGLNTYTAIAKDAYGRTDSSTISVDLPVSVGLLYDLNGNLRSDGRRAFEYDDENQLVSVLVTNAWKSEFAYDGKMRRRVRKEYTWTGSAWSLTNEVRYIYDRMLVIQERSGGNQPLVTYARGLDLSGTFEGAGGIGGLLARTDPMQPSLLKTAFYHSDGNGNVTALVSTNGLIVARYHYDPYGNTLAASGPLAEANVYRFSSKEWHANAGLYYYGYRFYEPNLQRWLNRDPVQEFGGLNLYTYVGNDALNEIDLLGLAYGDWYDPRSYFQEGLGGIWRVLYTGSATSSDEVYNAATDAAGDYVYENGGVRGGYIGVGAGGKLKGKGNLAGYSGLTGAWTLDDGAALDCNFGLGLQDRAYSQFGTVSETLGVGGGAELWNETDGWHDFPTGSWEDFGIYGGRGNKVGGAHFAAPANGIAVDPQKVITNFRHSFQLVF